MRARRGRDRGGSGGGAYSKREMSLRHRANALTNPYTRSAALSRTAPPSELACSWLNLANSGLSNRSGKQNSLWYSVGRHAGASVVAKMPVNTAIFTIRRLLCLYLDRALGA